MTMIASPAGPIADDRKPLSGWSIFVYAFAQYAAWLAIMTPVIITIALRVEQIAPPAQKAAYLATILSIGAFCAMIAAPIWGAISDQTTARIGKRKTWIALGALMLLCGLLTMALSTSITLFAVGWFICQIGSNATTSALSAILPDQVPLSQRGKVSAILGLTIVLALVSGNFLTQFTHENRLAMFIVPWLPSIVSVSLVLRFLPDSSAEKFGRFAWRQVFASLISNPFRDRDFGWTFVSRFLLAVAFSFSLTYQVFFLTDYLHVGRADVPRTMFYATSIVAVLGLILTPLAGWLVDVVGRIKPFVIGPALVTALGLLWISQSRSVTHFMIALVAVGIGKGIYYAIDVALCASVLPDKDRAAKDMGIFQMANSLPQSIAPALAPLFLAIGGGNQNYPAVFIAATMIALASALAILPIRRVR